MDALQFICIYSCLWLVTFTMGVEYKRLCYFASWAQYRVGDARFTVNDINPHLCTHIMFAFAKLNEGKIQYIAENDPETYKTLVNLKRNSTIKVMISVGGASASLVDMSQMLHTVDTRQTFVTSCVIFLRKYGFDGLDLDFEYPGKAPQSGPADKQRFGILLQKMREEFDAEAARTKRDRLLLSVVVPTHKRDVDNGYDVQQLIKYTDFINMLTYDYHGGWEEKTGHNSPLYEPSTYGAFSTGLNMNYGALYWVRLGVPTEQLIVGMAAYGRGFLLRDAAQTGIGAPVSGSSPPQKNTKEQGFIGYSEVCQHISDGAIVMKLEDQQVPYFYWGNLWVGYDDEQSLRNKVRWLKAVGFGGYLVWDITMDDHRDVFCGNGPFPLLNALNDELNAPYQDPLKPPSYLFETRCGPCVSKDSGYDCDPAVFSRYHQCSDGLVVFTSKCPNVSPWFNTVTEECVNQQSKEPCADTLKCGSSREGHALQKLGFLHFAPPPGVDSNTTKLNVTTFTSAGVRHVEQTHFHMPIILVLLGMSNVF